MKASSRFFIALIACIGLGIGLGYAFVKLKNPVVQLFLPTNKHYETVDNMLQNKFELTPLSKVQWSQLLPNHEKSILKKYQQTKPTTPSEFTDNILLSLQASGDSNYKDAMISVNTVDRFSEKPISIAGFIVPIDYHDDKSLRNIFIVPYFGACIHFPPPPPNQIIFAQLSVGFIKFDITQAYKFDGLIRTGLFEDPIGTSAYILDVVSIESYFENPDDFRRH